MKSKNNKPSKRSQITLSQSSTLPDELKLTAQLGIAHDMGKGSDMFRARLLQNS